VISAFGVEHEISKSYVPFTPRVKLVPGSKAWNRQAKKLRSGKYKGSGSGRIYHNDGKGDTGTYQRPQTTFRRAERTIFTQRDDVGPSLHVFGGELRRKNIALAAAGGTAVVGAGGVAAKKHSSKGKK
jgi:hypothetical protein